MKCPTGVCTWTFGPLPLETVVARIATLGFDGLEIYGDLTTCPVDRLRDIVRGAGLRVLSVTPDNADIAHPDPLVRAAAVDYYLHLLEFSAELGAPVTGVHGWVGRIQAVADHQAEWRLLVDSCRQISQRALALGVPLAFEVLNRYESHLVNTGQEGLELLRQVGSPALKLLLDTYHMNIEEADPAQALRDAAGNLALVHVADSNRAGLGLGHTDFPAILEALDAVAYRGPIVVEATASGPNPFTPVKAGDYLGQLESYLTLSLAVLSTWNAALPA